MSWKLIADENIIITTGDGLEYRPRYVNSVKSFEFNISSFNFPGIEGTLVSRGQRQGSTLTLLIIFQGENHLDEAEGFEQSSKDRRPWTINHPFHGVLTMHPTKISFDNTKFNVSEITIELIETITQDAPIVGVDPTNQVQINAANLDDSTSQDFANEILTTTDTVLMSSRLDDIYNEGISKVESDSDWQVYFNAFQQASSAVLTATSKPLEAIQTVRSVIMAPSLFAISVKARLTMLKNQLESLINIVYKTPNEKKIFENYGNGVISAMVLTTTYPQEDDFKSAPDVLDVIGTINTQYDLYITTLEGLQTDTGDDLESYLPSQGSLIGLQQQVAYAVSTLLQIAIGAQQERELILENDSNVITLSHRFYGLESDDSTIERFINTNQIGLRELLQIRKGRVLKYYV